MNILATSAAFRPARREGLRPSPVVEYAIEVIDRLEGSERDVGREEVG